MNIRSSVFTILALFCAACFQVQADNKLNDLLVSSRTKFIDILQAKYNDFELCEAISKSDDKKEFLNWVFDTKIFSNAKQVKSSELFSSYEGATSRLHLGTIGLEFASSSETEKVFKQISHLKKNYFDKTKVLTKYKVYRLGEYIVFVYSETFLKDELKRYFEESENIFQP